MKMSKSVIFIIVFCLLIVIGVFIYFSSQKTSPAEPNNATTTVTDQYMAAIAACYPQGTTGASQAIPNNSTQDVKTTSRVFINLPKNLYPQDLQYSWTTVSGNATAGSVSGGYGAVSGCWSSYVEFDGNGEIDLRVKSVVAGTPDYFVRFIVSQ